MSKKIPEIDFSYADIMTLQYNTLKWELLKTAIEIKTFDHLEKPKRASEFAKELNFNMDNTVHFLKTLTACGFLIKDGDYYQNSETTSKFLVSDRDRYIGAYANFVHGWNTPILNGNMVELLKSGPKEDKDVFGNDMFVKVSQESAKYSLCGRGKNLAEHVAKLPEFTNFKKAMDMGGGPAIISIALAELKPDLHITLLDSEGVCDIADKYIKEYEMQDRIKTFPANYIEDDIGSGYDLLMANFSLNIDKEFLEPTIEKVYNSLSDGGVFFITTIADDDDDMGEEISMLNWLSPKMLGMNTFTNANQFEKILAKAGFKAIEKFVIDNEVDKAHGKISAIAARKI